MRVSLIVTTYDWKEALALTLASVARQSRAPDEVIVADDGSRSDTRAMLEALARAYPVPLRHVWQDDRGFRAARARNRGIAASRGDYVVITDGDMVLHRHFIADHLAFAQPGRFPGGGRLRATPRETARLLNGRRARFVPWIDADFSSPREFKRRHALRWPWLARSKARSRPGRIMSCNMSFWRADLLRVNGFDERMASYGSEDLELGARLKNAGVHRLQLKFAALAVHLHHQSRAPADPDDPASPNNRILLDTRSNGVTRCVQGIDAHLAEFATAPPDLRLQSGAR
ncbi:MAG TPA: glycosyltransferase family 2 protein [Rhodanobacteraceae bacterium]|nr:glycosyltransferase family 2 protein [Rhodanobacteraceae bacterium]